MDAKHKGEYESYLAGKKKAEDLFATDQTYEDILKACGQSEECQVHARILKEREVASLKSVLKLWNGRNPTAKIEIDFDSLGNKRPREVVQEEQVQQLAEQGARDAQTPPNPNPPTAQARSWSQRVRTLYDFAGTLGVTTITGGLLYHWFQDTSKLQAQMSYCTATEKESQAGQDPVVNLTCNPDDPKNSDQMIRYKTQLGQECLCDPTAVSNPMAPCPSAGCVALTKIRCPNLPTDKKDCQNWDYAFYKPNWWGLLADLGFNAISQTTMGFGDALAWILEHGVTIGVILILLVVMGWAMSFYRSFKIGG